VRFAPFYDPVSGNVKWEHLTFAAKLEIGARSQELEARRKEEERRRQKKCFYKYEMLPINWAATPCARD